MPLISTRAAASAQGFGEFSASADPVYIEQIFSTYLYTGNGSTQTITNNIDLSTKGGLVWTKARNTSTTGNNHILTDTARGAYRQLSSDTTGAEYYPGAYGVAFTTSGFSLTSDVGNNSASDNYASWTFRKQLKFFDVVTYTGNGSSQTISHSLGSTPGCIIIKKLDSTTFNAGWAVYHRSLTNPSNYYLVLNTTAAETNYGGNFISSVGSTTFTVAGASGFLGLSGSSYVAYLFAHDAGGFGLSGTDNVISCGSFTTNGSGVIPAVTLGYEPQWVLIKETSGPNSWFLFDTMRQMSMTNAAYLNPNSSGSEALFGYGVIAPTSTGFIGQSGSPPWNPSATFIYIAIRRGPMKVPTTGTSVFTPIARTGDGSSSTVVNVGFPTDLFMFKWRALGYTWKQQDRLRGFVQQLASDATSSESNSGTYTFGTVGNTGYTYGSNAGLTNELNGSGVTSAVYAFQRAPGFFDVVCWTATSGINTITHNLGVAPELCIYKRRNGAAFWAVLYSAGSGTVLELNSTLEGGVIDPVTYFTSNGSTYTAPSATSLFLNTLTNTGTYVAYLFATVAGVSKVGSYTGNGSNQTINCGFTGGSRFVLIKRTDSTGDWYCWDSARGIVSGNDPHLSLNTTAAEVTTDDSVDTDSTGFIVNQLAATNINVSSASYIFLAVA
jgi:hypothetical protein